jgi:tetratricopeptide (TPR) repeat protein
MLETPEKLREAAVNYFNESLDLMKAERYEEAFEFLLKAESAAQEIKDGAILFHTLKVRGQLLQALGRFEEALEVYAFSLKTNEELLENDPDNELYLDALHMNLNNIGNLGNLFQRIENFKSSQQCYEIGIEISQKRLDFQPENEFYQMYSGNTFNNLGELFFREREIDKARENYEKALKSYEKLLKSKPDNSEYLSDAAMTLNNLGTLFSEKGEKEKAKENFKKALGIMESLSRKSPEDEKLKEELNLAQGRLKKL